LTLSVVNAFVVEVLLKDGEKLFEDEREACQGDRISYALPKPIVMLLQLIQGISACPPQSNDHNFGWRPFDNNY